MFQFLPWAGKGSCIVLVHEKLALEKSSKKWDFDEIGTNYRIIFVNFQITLHPISQSRGTSLGSLEL